MLPLVERLFFRRSFRRAFSLRCLICLLVWQGSKETAPLCATEPMGTKEDALKAAILYNFTKFVEWPKERFENSTSPLTIGVLGKTPLREELEKAVRDRKLNGHRIVVKAVEETRLESLHLLFVGSGEEEKIATHLAGHDRTGLLTIGESNRFADDGGMIVLMREGDKFRFKINLNAAEQAGLKISAQLLKLAVEVRR